MTNATTKTRKQRLLTLVITLIMLCMSTMTAYASEVRSLSIKVKSTGDLSLPEITESSSKYDITSITWNKTENFKAGERVRATVTVSPLDDNEILLKNGRSSINISGTGAELYKYKRDGENFILEIDYIIKGELESPEEAYWDENNVAVARCTEVQNADEYRFVLYKGSKEIADKTTKKPSYNFAKELAAHFYDRNKKDFYFAVRVTSNYGSSYKSDYIESEYFDQWTDLYYYCRGKGIEVNFSSSNNTNPESGSGKKNDWRYENDGWYFYNNDGTKLKGWTLIKDVWYYLDPENGKMQTGWKFINNQWYYMNASGEMQTGWRSINNQWYYMNTSGEMQTGWQTINSQRYYLDSSGAMRTGWFKDTDNRWYYLNESYPGLPEGAMCSGWWNLGGNYFYMYPSSGYYNGIYAQKGEMAKNTVIDGFKLQSDGRAIVQ